MKKSIIIIVLGVICIGLSGLCYGMYKSNQDLSKELDISRVEASDKIDSKNEEIDNLEDRVDELEEQVYNIINKKNYDVTIKHDGDTINYTRTKKGLFSDETTSVTR